MRTRQLLTAATLTVAAFSAAACGPTSTTAKPAPAATVTVTATPSTGAAPANSPSAPAPASAGATQPDLPLDSPPPADNCSPAALPAHTKVVHPTVQPAQNLLYAQDTKFACDPNDGHWEAVGSQKQYQFAATVKSELAMDSGGVKSVLLGDLWQHIGDCLAGGADVKSPYTCSSGGAYRITLDASGKISAISEVFHP